MLKTIGVMAGIYIASLAFSMPNSFAAEMVFCLGILVGAWPFIV